MLKKQNKQIKKFKIRDENKILPHKITLLLLIYFREISAILVKKFVVVINFILYIIFHQMSNIIT